MSSVSIRRGDVVRVRLDPVVGAAGVRPALVLSPDTVNGSAPVVIVAAITSKKTDRIYSFEAALVPPEGGLTQPSKVLLLHLRSIDKRRIVGSFGALTDATMRRVEAALRVAVGLTAT